MFSKVATFCNRFVGVRLRGRRGTFHGITALYLGDPKPFHDDLPKIFALVKTRRSILW